MVTETLAGRGDRLSERTVGRCALGRGADFNGTASASVRVRASRVRQALGTYHAGEGREDPVRISVPAGRYVADVTMRPSAAEVAAPVPGVAVIAWRATGVSMRSGTPGGEPVAAVAPAGTASTSTVEATQATARMRDSAGSSWSWALPDGRGSVRAIVGRSHGSRIGGTR